MDQIVPGIVAILFFVSLASIGLGILIHARSRSTGWRSQKADHVLAASRTKVLSDFRRRLQWAVRQHPAKLYGFLETGFWSIVLLSLIDHISSPRGSKTGLFIWAITIVPHEVGHVVCSPFGRFLTIAGGSIWQVLLWLLLGSYFLLIRRQITSALLSLAIAGHSIINLSVYIADAAARQLPLLFAWGPDSHDWWNLLTMTGLLNYDQVLAKMAVAVGALIVLLVVGAGLFVAWFLPAARGGGPRFQGNVFRALADAWNSAAGGDLQ